jgi:ribose transport system permease protein
VNLPAAANGAKAAVRDLASSAVPTSASRRRRYGRLAGPRNIGAVYVLVILCIGFSIDLPHLFPAIATVQQVLNSGAIVALAALAVIVPLSARIFDLSFGYTMSLSGIICTNGLIVSHQSLVLCLFLALGASLLVGILNSIVVVVLRIDSFIGTLGTGSLVAAFTLYVSGGSTLTGAQLGQGFAKIYSTQIFGLTAPVYYALALAVILWLLLEHTPTGRRFHAVGFNAEAAKLANIGVARLRICSLLISSVVAGFAGIVVASSTQTGDAQAGTPYLLLGFAAAFLGATQFKGGRFNAWGTITAVIMLETATIGLALAGAPVWAADMFTGVMLIAALSATGLQRRARGGRIRSQAQRSSAGSTSEAIQDKRQRSSTAD